MNSDPNRPSEPDTTVEHSLSTSDPERPLVLPDSIWQEMEAHLRWWLPNEGCGLLASTPDGDTDRAVHFFPGTNMDWSPVRFTMKSDEVIDAMCRTREEHWETAAIVHSHPRTPPELSATDVREAYHPQTRLLIVSFQHEQPVSGCWARSTRCESAEFRQVELRIEER